MADKVKGILLREEVFEALQALSDEQRGKLVLALIAEAGGVTLLSSIPSHGWHISASILEPCTRSCADEL